MSKAKGFLIAAYSGILHISTAQESSKFIGNWQISNESPLQLQ